MKTAREILQGALRIINKTPKYERVDLLESLMDANGVSSMGEEYKAAKQAVLDTTASLANRGSFTDWSDEHTREQHVQALRRAIRYLGPGKMKQETPGLLKGDPKKYVRPRKGRKTYPAPQLGFQPGSFEERFGNHESRF